MEGPPRDLRDFRMGITPYYLSLIDPFDPRDPVLRQIVPLHDEYVYRAYGDEDPLGEEKLSPVPGITHRYPDRVLMVISNSCAIDRRYCTRKRIMYEDATPDIEIDAMVYYIARTPTVRDVVVSGGDPRPTPRRSWSASWPSCGPSRTSRSSASAAGSQWPSPSASTRS